MAEETSDGSVFYWNVCAHRYGETVNRLVHQMAGTVDVCCLTEVTYVGSSYDTPPIVYTSHDINKPPTQLNGYSQLKAILGDDYIVRYCAPRYTTEKCLRTGHVYHGVGFGSALIYRKNLRVIGAGEYRIEFGSPDVSDRVLQYIVYSKGFVRYLVAHLHGVWLRSNTKGDDPLRDMQSLEVRNRLADLRKCYEVTRTIFGGDLNLALDTRALKVLEEPAYDGVGLQNLVRKYGISSTRTPFYRYFGRPGMSMHADHVLVSPDVKDHSLRVDRLCPGSDHAPMLVTFT